MYAGSFRDCALDNVHDKINAANKKTERRGGETQREESLLRIKRRIG